MIRHALRDPEADLGGSGLADVSPVHTVGAATSSAVNLEARVSSLRKRGCPRRKRKGKKEKCPVKAMAHAYAAPCPIFSILGVASRVLIGAKGE